jgi:hypothetical protein
MKSPMLAAAGVALLAFLIVTPSSLDRAEYHKKATKIGPTYARTMQAGFLFFGRNLWVSNQFGEAGVPDS